MIIKYTYQELINHSLGLKANLTFEFKNINGLFKITIFDPLGCCYYSGTDLKLAVASAIKRLLFLKSVTRNQTIKVNIEKNKFIDIYNNQTYKKFIMIVKEYAKVFHSIMNPEKNVTRFLGNASLRPKLSNFRCTKGMPSFRVEKYIFVSQRNIDKEFIDIDNFVPTYIENNKIYYCGDKKPSVDAPIQLRLYNYLPNINYIIHSHCYIKDGIYTSQVIPCGAIEEVEEIINTINKTFKSLNLSSYKINLFGHGSIAMAKDLKELENIEYKKRDLLEKIY